MGPSSFIILMGFYATLMGAVGEWVFVLDFNRGGVCDFISSAAS